MIWVKSMSQFHDLINSNLIQGKIFFDKSLENLTWLKVGGKASCLYIPKNKEDLAVFLKQVSKFLIFSCPGAPGGPARAQGPFRALKGPL